jgi:hypothetical protein
MKRNRFKKGFVWFFFMVFCFPLLGQVWDSLTLPREARLNERQPPDLVLKKVQAKTSGTARSPFWPASYNEESAVQQSAALSTGALPWKGDDHA